MKKKLFIVFSFVLLAFSVFAPLVVSAESSRQEWVSISEFSYSMSSFGLDSVKQAFFTVPAGTSCSVTNNNGTTVIAQRNVDMYTCVFRDGSGFKLEFHLMPDFSDTAVSRVINSSHVTLVSPPITPDEFDGFYDKITVLQGVRWSADDGSIFSTIRSTLSHYIFNDNFDGVPFGTGWVDMLSTIACVLLFAFPLIIVFFVLRRFF